MNEIDSKLKKLGKYYTDFSSIRPNSDKTQLKKYKYLENATKIIKEIIENPNLTYFQLITLDRIISILLEADQQIIKSNYIEVKIDSLMLKLKSFSTLIEERKKDYFKERYQSVDAWVSSLNILRIINLREKSSKRGLGKYYHLDIDNYKQEDELYYDIRAIILNKEHSPYNKLYVKMISGKINDMLILDLEKGRLAVSSKSLELLNLTALVKKKQILTSEDLDYETDLERKIIKEVREKTLYQVLK